ncbi:uncharacterized protein LOC110717342 [Chenopodium quinoa]|uniref:uncharacterized protein LOC110717342 n=1 Tax=Chenopodium quinoa TaxID=63459 RepID=UPI000B7876CB|nr:uncharacterized protein LOC110717342 [Chenopodium quinoa]
MKIVAWNCRGLGQADSPKVPYIASLVRSHSVDVVFLAETMVCVNSAMHKLSSLSYSGFVGVDSVGLSGGLCVFWFSPVVIDPVLVSPHVILCRIVENLVIKYALFLYGAPQVSDRMTVWSEISNILATYPNVVLVGDFNQEEYLSDKVGGNLDIPGRHDFMQWKLDMGLLYIPFTGPGFTWTNGRLMSDPTFERLDKAYATSLWLQDRPATFVQHQPILFSDHAAIILSDSSSTYMVRSVFAIHVPVSHMFSLSRRLCILRHRLLAWCVTHKKMWGIDWKSLVADVSQASVVLNSRYDRCLFHKARRRKNYILGLRDTDGPWVSDVGGIRSIALNFYKVLYSGDSQCSSSVQSSVSRFSWDSLHLPSLSDTHRQSLLAPFSADDIKRAMFSIADDKSPGPDGFSSAFFKTYWHEVGNHVITAVQFFFAHGYLLKDWNRTFLVLIPKVDHPEFISQFRPIGLCNVVYICITKCLSHRLRGVLPDLVSDYQNAFIPGRLMSDNCLMVHELISFTNASKARKRFYAALKIDMNKAYDRVSWEFLSQVLQVFGFPPYWIHLIMQCVSTVSYQVLVNGAPSESFRPQCGLRQGDPLSPYLFVLCMEVLSAMLRKAEMEELFHGIKISRGAPSISHLFFADDSLLFFHVSPTSYEQVMNVLSEFCAISGQMLNMQKSFVKFSPNTPEDYRAYLSKCLQLRSESRFGTYLGLPVDLGRSKCSEFGFLVDKVAKRLEVFAALHLSPAAKLIIINSVLLASFNHILSVFQIPDSICSRVDNLLAKFWWKSSQSSRGMALRSSKLLHLPKGLGGLGIRSLAPFNSALLAKQSWRLIQSPQLLVSRLLFAKCPSLAGGVASSVSRLSWGCRGLLSGLSVLSKGLVWKVGSGSRVRILEDSWAPGGQVQFKDFPSEAVRPTFVSSLLDPHSYAWDTLIVHRLFDSLSATRILSLDRPGRQMDDFVYWKFTRDGVFSTKSAYAFLCQSPMTPGFGSRLTPTWWRRFWQLHILPRWKVFGWKILHDALPMEPLLHSRGFPVDPVCAFCHQEWEEVSHTFRDCPAVRSLWQSGTLGVCWDLWQFFQFGEWLADTISRFYSHKFWKGIMSLFAILWAIWLSRNQLRFRHAVWSPRTIEGLAEDWFHRCVQSQDWKKSVLGSCSPSSHVLSGDPWLCLRGLPDISPTVCLIVDGAWDCSTCRAGAGWVIRDLCSSEVLGGGSRAFLSGSALQSELQPCLWGLQAAVRKGFLKIRIHSDCATLLSMILNSGPMDISVWWLILELRAVVESFLVCQIRKVPRSWVSPAHWCLCFAHNQNTRDDKFASRSRKCVFLGYPFEKKGWRLYDLESKKFFVSRDVKFVEDVFPFGEPEVKGASGTNQPSAASSSSSSQHPRASQLAGNAAGVGLASQHATPAIDQAVGSVVQWVLEAILLVLRVMAARFRNSKF